MRRGPIVVIVVAMGVLLALGLKFGLEVFRSRLEQSDALRQSLVAAVEAQLGVGFEPGPIEVRFRPTGLRLAAPVLQLAGGVRLALPETDVSLASGELLEGRARLEAVSMSGPAGLQLESLELRGALTAQLRADPAASGWLLEADARLDSGGLLSTRGRVESNSRFQGEISIDELNVAPFAALLASDQQETPRLDGAFSGKLELGEEGKPATLRLASPQAELQLPPIVLQGPVAFVAELPGPGDASSRRFAVDASRALVDYSGSGLGGGFTRASGQGASVEGNVVRKVDGRLGIEAVALKIQNFQAERRREHGREPGGEHGRDNGVDPER
jgi:hypothetical protein